MIFSLVVGNTRTAVIDGISAAGATPEVMTHTPAADAELLTYGRLIRAPQVPVSPTGCPTPALVTRAVRERTDFEVLVFDAGLEARTGAPTVDMADTPGGDIRNAEPVPHAHAIFSEAKAFAEDHPDDELYIGESIPGGTTTALGVLRALGESYAVSSSLPDNPLSLKEDIVAEGLEASSLELGGASSDPITAIRTMGDPALATITGLIVGAVHSGTSVTLAGGTQLLTAAALARHLGIDDLLTLSTTSFVAEDDSIELETAAGELALDLRVTDPAFEELDHPGLAGYIRGEAKEGVGMGGALYHAEQNGVSMAEVRDRSVELYERLVTTDGS